MTPQIDLQSLRATIIEQILFIDNRQLLEQIEQDIMRKSQSPIAYTVEQVKAILLEQDQEPNPTYVAHEDIVKMASQW